MGLFKRKPSAEVNIQPANGSRVEIEVHKDASRQAKQKADDANAHLKNLLEQNGFTLKIYLAAGGKKPTTRGQGN